MIKREKYLTASNSESCDQAISWALKPIENDCFRTYSPLSKWYIKTLPPSAIAKEFPSGLKNVRDCESLCYIVWKREKEPFAEQAPKKMIKRIIFFIKNTKL